MKEEHYKTLITTHPLEAASAIEEHPDLTGDALTQILEFKHAHFTDTINFEVLHEIYNALQDKLLSLFFIIHILENAGHLKRSLPTPMRWIGTMTVKFKSQKRKGPHDNNSLN